MLEIVLIVDFAQFFEDCGHILCGHDVIYGMQESGFIYQTCHGLMEDLVVEGGYIGKIHLLVHGGAIL